MTPTARATEPAAADDRFRALFDHAGEGLAVFDAAGHTRVANPAFRAQVGYDAEERAGRSAFELVHPDDVGPLQQAFRAVLARPGAVGRAECRVRHRDGRWRIFAFTATNRLDDPAVGGVIVATRDVTDAREAEAALRASEARFRAFVEQATDLVLVLDARMTIHYVAPRVTAMLGHAPAALVGTEALALVHPDDTRSAIEALAQAAATTEETVRAELRVRHADGSWRVMEALGRALGAGAGGADGSDGDAMAGDDPRQVLVILRDTTARRAAEQALRESEERFRSLSTSSPVGIFESDVDGRLTYVNPCLVELHGGSAAALLGRGWVELIHPEDRDALVAGWSAALAEGREYAHDYRVVRPDGGTRWVRGRAAPLHDAAGAVVGTVGTVEDVTARRALEVELERQALEDPLTGLANRTRFSRRLEAALGRDGGAGAATVAVLFLDLDDFKRVNDSLGHAAGDRLLVEVAARLLNATRGSDTVARLGGDEFAVLLEQVRGDDDVTVVADRIVGAMRAPVTLDGQPTRIGASVGIARAAIGTSAADLLRNADVAMYRAKSGGKGRHAAYSAELHASALDRLTLGAALPDALAAGQFVVHYQPIVALDSHRVVGAEALVRWRHPERGLLTPDAFIALAEETGAIVPLGRWVLRQACADAAGWGVGAAGGAPWHVAVNLSGRQLEDAGLVADVADALAAAGLAPGRLVLEMTESVLVHHTDAVVARLHALKALGVQLAIDDFGTGYSSLAYLHRFPVDVIKVDRAFVARVGAGGRDAALARTIVALGEALGLRTVAEGIETAAQEEQLRALGCELGQGFHYARPMAVAGLAAHPAR